MLNSIESHHFLALTLRVCQLAGFVSKKPHEIFGASEKELGCRSNSGEGVKEPCSTSTGTERPPLKIKHSLRVVWCDARIS